ncbi:MAG: two-component system response regulator [Candidatus Omnitrophica bacterium CG11_big_fil_rev_8_21_14_0_20_63_9]|nr:MAG: two-component system response regulator [Candidatus Omnitrophica bacterium CG11_big_fil_rev_8_21_14_0_20_63_9]
MAQPKMVAIDDEVEFTKTIDSFFGNRGYEVHVALTGISGLELIEYHKPDVVLVDLKLPGMDGDQILQQIRKHHPEIKVIVITAYNDGGKTRDRLLALGAFAHFDKPVSSLRDLAEAVKRALAQPSTSQPQP